MAFGCGVIAGMAGFAGFPKETVKFIRQLSKNNNKQWFDQHRADYEEHYIAPAKAFVEAIAPGLKKIDSGLQAEPKVNGSIFRINRDIRFSKDKTPYKDHLDLWFWSGDKKGWDTTGLFFRITPKNLVLGAGMHKFEKQALANYRDAVADDKSGKELAKLAAKLTKAGYRLTEPSYKKVPRGFDPEHPRAELLKNNGLAAMLETKHPAELHTPKFPAFCLKHFKAVAAVNTWLTKYAR